MKRAEMFDPDEIPENKKRIRIVRDETPMDHLADLVVHESIGSVLGGAVDKLLG